MPREEINGLVLDEVLRLIHPQKQSPRSRVKIQRLSPTAKIPTRAYGGNAGLDIYADGYYSLFPGDITEVKTGIKIQIPKGYVGLIWNKSGLAKLEIHTVGGVIDSGYRGEIIILVKNLSEDIFNITKGQQIAQILIQKVEPLEIVENKIYDDTDRCGNGFGSSGLF
jgi:dUTP pyrophosphatase